MRQYKCNASVHYRWETEEDAITVFEALRQGRVWAPPDAVVLRLDGQRIAPYQPYWVSILWPNEKRASRPFKDWWQYMTAVGLPDHKGWKANWELDDQEQREYDESCNVIEIFARERDGIANAYSGGS
jgi:hypothetical protein